MFELLQSLAMLHLLSNVTSEREMSGGCGVCYEVGFENTDPLVALPFENIPLWCSLSFILQNKL